MSRGERTAAPAAASAAAAAAAFRWLAFGDLSALDLHRILRARVDVFVVEQACPYPEVDGLDPACLHVVGEGGGGDLLAYARVLPPGLKYPEAALGRVLTSLAVRGTGVGRALLAEALAGMDRRWPGVPVRIGAQSHLERFYGEFGFRTVSAPYEEDGIEHVEMLRAPADGASLPGANATPTA